MNTFNYLLAFYNILNYSMRKLPAAILFVLICGNSFLTFDANAFEYHIISNSVDSSFNGYDCVLHNTSDAATSYIGTIKDGKIDIRGESERSFPAFINVMSNNHEKQKRVQINLIVEPGTTTVDWNERYPVSGGNLNQGLKNFVAKLNNLATDPASQNEVWKSVFKENHNNGLGEYVLIMDAGFSCSPDEWTEAIGLLDDETKGMTSICDLTERMESLKTTWEGQKFTDLCGKSLDGERVCLSDFVGKGKFVIADIWASWCGGCIIEAKEMLIPLYNEYKDNQNVQFVGIALDDVSEAVKKLGIPWAQIMDCYNAMDTYCAYSIPEIIIFDPDGTILHRRLHGQEIAAKLKEELSLWKENPR